MSNDVMNFDDHTPIEVPVTYDGKQYTLREATGDAACKYKNALLACTQLGPDGKPVSVRGMADVEPMLVAMCLFDEQGKPVKGTTIRSWPSRIQTALFDRAKEISSLDEEEDDKDEDDDNEEEAAKNELEHTGDGSD